MTLIKKSNEIERPKNVRIMIYGQSGTGKTTFALSSKNTLLLDFDNGVHRIEPQHRPLGIVQIKSYQDVLDVLQEDLNEYNTVVVDTIGKLLDYIIIHICGAKQPRIQDWGKINQTFSDFNRNLYHSGKNVVYVAHRDVRKEGDENVFVPALREKSYSSIVADIDLLGYLEMGSKGRTLTFNPTTRNDGKNTCRLSSNILIPNALNKENQSLETLILKPYKDICLHISESEKAFIEIMQKLEDDIATIPDAADANRIVNHIDDYAHVGNSKIIAGTKLAQKCRTLGLVLNKQTKLYELAY
jgi:phage nucleotide-binding protein